MATLFGNFNKFKNRIALIDGKKKISYKKLLDIYGRD